MIIPQGYPLYAASVATPSLAPEVDLTCWNSPSPGDVNLDQIIGWDIPDSGVPVPISATRGRLLHRQASFSQSASEVKIRGEALRTVLSDFQANHQGCRCLGVSADFGNMLPGKH